MLALALLAAGGAALLFVDDDGGEGAGGRPDAAGPRRLGDNEALLYGSVVDAESKAPIAGAKLVIDQEGGRLTATTDKRGRYETVVNAIRPIGFTVDAPGHQGGAGFGKLCAGERRKLDITLPPATARSAPPAPLILREACP